MMPRNKIEPKKPTLIVLGVPISAQLCGVTNKTVVHGRSETALSQSDQQINGPTDCRVKSNGARALPI